MLWIEIETCLTFLDFKFSIFVYRILVVVVVVYVCASLDSVF